MKTSLLNFLRKVFFIKPFERVLVKLTSRKEFGNFITKLPPNHYQYKPQTIRKVNRNGINYYLDISDIVDWYIYYGFKENSRENLYSNIKKEDIVLDVGANVGDVSMMASKIVSEKGYIYGFEPDPTNFLRLNKNLSLNNFQNIDVINKGIGDKKGRFSLSIIDDRNRGMNKIVKTQSGTNTINEIDVIRLDDFVNERGLKKIDVIKIDVEGFEMNVLKGAEAIIKKYQPILFIEIDDNHLKEQNTSAKELVSLVKSLGYNITNAETNSNIDTDIDFKNCHFDILCTNK